MPAAEINFPGTPTARIHLGNHIRAIIDLFISHTVYRAARATAQSVIGVADICASAYGCNPVLGVVGIGAGAIVNNVSGSIIGDAVAAGNMVCAGIERKL